MRAKAIIKHLGYVILFNSFFLFIASAVSLYNGESSFNPLFYTALIGVAIGLTPQLLIEKIIEINFNEGLAISVFGWIATCLFGAIPYVMWGGEFTIGNAIFESVSGYTTTGATILQDIETLTKGLLFWRSATHFIGGIGVILFVLLILPNTKGVQAHIYKSEVSNLSSMSFIMRTKQAVRVISMVYVGLNVILTLLLWLQGMTFFDAVCHSFSTIATGGFSTKNLSIAYFDNIGIEITLTVFMYLSSLHFGLLFLTITGSENNIFKSKLVWMFTLVLIFGIMLITLNLMLENNYSFSQALRHASFQVVSLSSTTGSATIDTNTWPVFSKIIMIYFMIQCAMAGSTGGGIKFDRIYIYFASLRKRIKLMMHPKGLYAAKVNGKPISQDIEHQVLVFIILYVMIFFVVTLILSAMHIEGMTALSASISTIGNVGPGFNEIGSLGNYSQFPLAAKYLLSINMIIGRLEILNVFTLFIILVAKN